VWLHTSNVSADATSAIPRMVRNARKFLIHSYLSYLLWSRPMLSWIPAMNKPVAETRSDRTASCHGWPGEVVVEKIDGRGQAKASEHGSYQPRQAVVQGRLVRSAWDRHGCFHSGHLPSIGPRCGRSEQRGSACRDEVTRIPCLSLAPP